MKALCGTPEFVAPEVVSYDFISTGTGKYSDREQTPCTPSSLQTCGPWGSSATSSSPATPPSWGTQTQRPTTTSASRSRYSPGALLLIFSISVSPMTSTSRSSTLYPRMPRISSRSCCDYCRVTDSQQSSVWSIPGYWRRISGRV